MLVGATSAQGIYTSFIGGYRQAAIPITSEIVARKQTVRLESGTGFLLAYTAPDEKIYIFLVTAKHLLEDATQIRMTMNRKPLPTDLSMASLIVEETVELSTGLRSNWSVPDTAGVDIAVVLLEKHENAASRNTAIEHVSKGYAEGRKGFIAYANSAIEYTVAFSTKDFDTNDELLDVVFFGYPLGLVSDYAANPIARSGSIALSSLKGVSAGKDIDYPEEAFLISGTVYPGNSGGPVILRRTYIGEGTTQITTVLAGVVSAYIPSSDVIVNLRTGQPKSFSQENTGLAIVFPSKFIGEAISKIISNTSTKP